MVISAVSTLWLLKTASEYTTVLDSSHPPLQTHSPSYSLLWESTSMDLINRASAPSGSLSGSPVGSSGQRWAGERAGPRHLFHFWEAASTWLCPLTKSHCSFQGPNSIQLPPLLGSGTTFHSGPFSLRVVTGQQLLALVTVLSLVIPLHEPFY